MRKIAEKKGAGIQLPPENLDGYTFCLLGKSCKIRVVSTSKVGYDSENHTIYLPDKNPQERLVKWLKDNAKRILTAVAAETAIRMNVSYKSVGVTSARGRWGSCSGDNAIHFSFRLIYAPKDVIEYVVVHELAHTKHHNHSPLFWAEVEKFVPDWKKKRAWLKQNGGFMEIF